MRRAFFGSILVTLALSAQAFAQAVLPATPVGLATEAYLEALNSGDRAKAVSFIKDRFPTSPIGADGLVAFERQTGGLELVRIEAHTPTALTALMRERYGETYARLQIEIEPGVPHHIRTLGARVTPRPADILAPARLSDAELAKVLAKKLGLMGDDYSGVVLVARKGAPVATFAQGWADRERQIPNSQATRFRVGSMDKMFTAVAVMQLAQTGKLDLQAPLITYLKTYPNTDWARKVTVQHLLTHTGGAGDIFTPEYNDKREQLRTLQDYIDLYGTRASDFEPGAKWEYANYGYILLGRVVEVVSGQSYYDYVADHVFKPANMTGSGFEPETTPVPHRAVAYERTETGFKPTGDLPWRGTSAGGGYSTAEDFLKFATAFYDGRLLDEAHREQMTTGRFEDGTGMKYGYGIAVYPTALPMVGHNGAAPGMAGDLRIISGGEGVVVTLSNVTPPFLAGRLSRFISERFAERE